MTPTGRASLSAARWVVQLLSAYTVLRVRSASRPNSRPESSTVAGMAGRNVSGVDGPSRDTFFSDRSRVLAQRGSSFPGNMCSSKSMIVV